MNSFQSILLSTMRTVESCSSLDVLVEEQEIKVKKVIRSKIFSVQILNEKNLLKAAII